MSNEENKNWLLARLCHANNDQIQYFLDRVSCMTNGVPPLVQARPIGLIDLVEYMRL